MQHFQFMCNTCIHWELLNMFNINDKHRYMQRQAPLREDIKDKINNQFNFLLRVFDKIPTYIQAVVLKQSNESKIHELLTFVNLTSHFSDQFMESEKIQVMLLKWQFYVLIRVLVFKKIVRYYDRLVNVYTKGNSKPGDLNKTYRYCSISKYPLHNFQYIPCVYVRCCLLNH